MTEDELQRRAVELTGELGALQERTVRASRERRDVLNELHQLGWSDERIATLLGITRQAVATIRARN